MTAPDAIHHSSNFYGPIPHRSCRSLSSPLLRASFSLRATLQSHCYHHAYVD